jgi:hypothetical protein
VRHVALLAAAVPQQLCLPPYQFQAYLRTSTEDAYFSRKDRALGILFDAGQNEYGEFGEAVGRDGRPDGRWDNPVDTGLGHSGYWPSSAVAASVAGAIGRLSSDRVPRLRPEARIDVPPLPPPRRTVARRNGPHRP